MPPVSRAPTAGRQGSAGKKQQSNSTRGTAHLQNPRKQDWPKEAGRHGVLQVTRKFLMLGALPTALVSDVDPLRCREPAAKAFGPGREPQWCPQRAFLGKAAGV